MQFSSTCYYFGEGLVDTLGAVRHCLRNQRDDP